MFKYNSNGFYLSSDYEMSNALSLQKYVDQEPLTWMDEYNKVLFSSKKAMPRPGIYQNKPCFYGGLYPIGCPKLEWGEVIIFNSKLRYEIIPLDKINIPTDNQYKKFFRAIINSNIIGIATLNPKMKNSKYPSGLNGDDFSFIQIGSNRYRWFDGYSRPWEKSFKSNLRNTFKWSS